MAWERVLWKKQSFPDNYVGESFFRIKKKSPEINLKVALLGTTSFSEELCSCFGLVAVFYGMQENLIPSSLLLLIIFSLTILLYLIMKFTEKYVKNRDNAVVFSTTIRDVKVASFTCMLLWLLTPIIQTLTGSVATDTIMASTTALLTFRLLIYPYGAQVSIENSVMSCNLGIFASICLASRLHNHEDVFALVITAVALFTLFPAFRNHCKCVCSTLGDCVVTILIILTTMAALGMYAFNLLLFLIVCLFIFNIVFPFLFVYMQHYRQNIYGPWDEAQIKESSYEN